MDGTASGRLKATLGNWTGITYLLPRTSLTLSRDREDLNQTGVYLLFGTDDETGRKQVYIGQGRERKNQTGVLGRIIEHVGEENLDYWTHAVVMVTSNRSFGPTEISYLENRFVALAMEARRYKVTNSQDPNSGSPTEEKRAELEEFIDYARLVIGALGYRVFEPVDERKSLSPVHSEEEPLLRMSCSGSIAKGRQTSDGFVVMAGSRLRPEREFTASVSERVRENRARYKNVISEDYTLTEDVLLGSPSAAAGFIGGASLSGNTQWRTEDGTPLGELEKREMERPSSMVNVND